MAIHWTAEQISFVKSHRVNSNPIPCGRLTKLFEKEFSVHIAKGAFRALENRLWESAVGKPRVPMPHKSTLVKSIDTHGTKLAASIFNVSHSTVFRWCKGYNIKLTPGTPRKYMLNESLFLVASSELCWILGWIASDGCIKTASNNVSISINKEDLDVLNKIGDLVFCKATPPHIRTEKSWAGTYLVNLNFTSNNIVNCLYSKGIKARKSLTIGKININSYHRDFVRGVFEGDGSVRISYKKGRVNNYEVSIATASKEFAQYLLATLNEHQVFGFRIRSYTAAKAKNPIYIIVATNKQSVLKFYLFIYGNVPEHLRMNRKYSKYTGIIKKLLE